jgi:hypothetical protein
MAQRRRSHCVYLVPHRFVKRWITITTLSPTVENILCESIKRIDWPEPLAGIRIRESHLQR